MVDILSIDDDPTFSRIVRNLLEETGYIVTSADTAEKALDAVRLNNGFDVVLLDQKLPDRSGMDILTPLQHAAPDASIIFVTGHADVALAVEAMKAGAFDFLTKPLDYDMLPFVVERAAKVAALERTVRILSDTTDESHRSMGIVTGCAPMLKVFDLVKRIAPRDATTLITGESGTGKELLAKAIHRLSRRSGGPFIEINCGAFTDDLLESQLFGFEKGAFTGATQGRAGCFEEAHMGTLFLDEVGDMSPKLQASLLRVLQERTFSRIGSFDMIESDFRLVAATNVDLEAAVAAGRFRSDLLYRLNVIPLTLPPLREREGDVPLLATHFLEMWRRRHEGEKKRFSPEAIDILSRHSWPGNCRELENAVEYMASMGAKETIGVADLPPALAVSPEEAGSYSGHSLLPYAEEKQAFEKKYLEQAHMLSEGNIARMAELTGIQRQNIYDKLRKHGIRD
jgi:two-component system response regulator HydG